MNYYALATLQAHATAMPLAHDLLNFNSNLQFGDLWVLVKGIVKESQPIFELVLTKLFVGTTNIVGAEVVEVAVLIVIIKTFFIYEITLLD